MAPGRRTRKRRRKDQDHLLWIAAAAAFFLLLILCIPLDDSGNFEEVGRSSRATSSLRLERCRSSCEDVILSSGGSLSDSLLSSSALASSAVDALFLLRDSDGDEDNAKASSTRKQPRKRKTDEKHRERSKSRGKDGSKYNSEDDFWRNVDPPPTRLPPIIETLVGSVDGRYPYRGYGQQGKSKEIIAQGDALHRSGVSSSSGAKVRGDTGNLDESVAMAAAAAAAAFWSQTTGRGRHRMKTVNEEWDKSLRWIAGWGQSLEGGDYNDGVRATRTDDRRKSHRAGKGMGDKKVSEKNVDFDDVKMSFLDACVKECVGNGMFKSGQRGSSVRLWHQHGSQLILTFMSSLLTGKATSHWGSVFSAEQRMFITGTIRIALSSAVLFCFRSAWKWLETYWLAHRSENTAWLLEEELVETKANTKNARRHTPKKKSSLSRRSRRRNQSQLRRGTSSETGEDELVSTIPPPHGNTVDEDEVDFDSLQRLISSDDKRRVAQKKAGGTSSRRVTSCQSNNSALVALDEKEDASDLSSERSKKMLQTGPTKQAQSQSGSRADGDAAFVQISVPTANKKGAACSEMGGGKTGRQKGLRLDPLPCSDGKTEEISGDLLVAPVPLTAGLFAEAFPNAKQTSLLGSLQQNSPAVPTDEQRDMAFRQLREYQRVQVLKIMQRKGLLDSPNANRATTSSVPVASTTLGASVFPVSRHGREASVIAPPPGLVLPQTCASAESSDDSGVDVDSFTSGKLLPSNILDGFEDEEEGGPQCTIKPKASALKAVLPKAYSPVLTGFPTEHAANPSRDSCWGPLKLSLDATQSVNSSGQTGCKTTTSGFEMPLDTTLSSWTSASDGSDGGSSVGKMSAWS